MGEEKRSRAKATESVDQLRGALVLERAEVKRLRTYIASLEARAAPDPNEGARLKARTAELESDLRNAKEALERGKAAWDLKRSGLEAKVKFMREAAVDYLKDTMISDPEGDMTPERKDESLARYRRLITALCIIVGPPDTIAAKIFDPAVAKMIDSINEAVQNDETKAVEILKDRLARRLKTTRARLP